MSRLRPAAVILVLAVTASCGSSDRGDGVAGAGPSTVATPASPTASVTPAAPTTSPIPLAERCAGMPGGPGSAAVVRAIPTASGENLYAVEAGSGRHHVVLVHGSGSRGLCNWWAELGWLPRAGFRVVAYDQSCVGGSSCGDARRPVEDLLSVVADLRKRGAAQVTVVGASAGGPIPLLAAARPGGGISAVVSLSGVGLGEPLGADDVRDASAVSVASSIEVPALLALAQDDASSSVDEHRAVQAAIGARNARLVILPAGSGHAQQLLYHRSGGAPSTFRPAFFDFVRSPSGR